MNRKIRLPIIALSRRVGGTGDEAGVPDTEEGAEGAAEQRLQRAALVPYLHRPAPPHNRNTSARPDGQAPARVLEQEDKEVRGTVRTRRG